MKKVEYNKKSSHKGILRVRIVLMQFFIEKKYTKIMKLKNINQIGFLDWWILIPLSVVMYLIFHIFAYFFLNILNHKLTAKGKGIVQFIGYTIVIIFMLLSLLSFL